MDNLYYELPFEIVIMIIEYDPHLLKSLILVDRRIKKYIDSAEGERWCINKFSTKTQNGLLIFDDIKHGRWNYVTLNLLTASYNYRWGALDGINIRYAARYQRIEKITTYVRGLKHGITINFFTCMTSDIKSEKMYIKGKLEGVVRVYDRLENGLVCLKFIAKYSAGKCLDKIYYDKNGILNGTYTLRYANNKIRNVRVFNNGHHVSTTDYYPDGNIHKLYRNSTIIIYTKYGLRWKVITKEYDIDNVKIGIIYSYNKFGLVKSKITSKSKSSVLYKYNILGQIKSVESWDNTFKNKSTCGKLLSMIN